MGGEEITVPDGEYLIYGQNYRADDDKSGQITLEINITPLFKFSETDSLILPGGKDTSSAEDQLEWINGIRWRYINTDDPSPKPGEIMFRGNQDLMKTLLEKYQKYPGLILPTWAISLSSYTSVFTASTALLSREEQDKRCCSIM